MGIVTGLTIADGYSGVNFSVSIVAYAVVSLLWLSLPFGCPPTVLSNADMRISNALLVETLGTKVCK